MPVKGLTQAEIDAATAAVVAAGGKSTDRTNRLPGETATEANARITAAYKAQTKPELTQEGKAAGAQIKFVRTEAGGVGKYKEIFPIGTPIPTTRTTEYGNVYDQQGNLVQGTGLKTGVPGTSTSQRTPDQIAAYNNAKALAQSFVDSYGGSLNDYFDSVTGKVTKPTAAVINKKFNTATGKKEISRKPNGDGTFTVTYSDGSTEVIGTKNNVDGDGTDGDGTDGDGSGLYVASDGKTFTNSDSFTIYQAGLDEKKANKISAYNLLYDEFDKYGLGTLVSDIRNILVEGSLDPAEFALKVRGTDAYKARFIANEARLAKGLKALSPAQYIALEDQYQEVMRQYGLPESYYAKTGTGVQEGFRKLIENDVSNVELEDRISTAQKRVLNANPEVTQALKQFYPDITNADILAYTLDPKNAIENIKRKVTAAEIGGAAIQSGLQTGVSRAEQLGAAGVTKDTAEKGFGTIAGGLQRGSQLASIYGEDPYTQTTAEKEVFGLAGKTEAEKQRKKLTGLEKATFGGQTGLTSGALARDRAGAY
jgi:hypothetical protein